MDISLLTSGRNTETKQKQTWKHHYKMLTNKIVPVQNTYFCEVKHGNGIKKVLF